MSKKNVFSGVQPSGSLTIGNYLGAIKNWKELQEEYNCIYSIVDMHAITIPQDPETLRERSFSQIALYLACGLDVNKSIIFIQSHVPEHAELSWILNTITYMGQLSRMTQYKDKTQKNEDNLNAGLFTYPVLMAADILLYNTALVPVGDDQKQHMEMARDLAVRFNNKYGDTFIVPDAFINKNSARIMSLQVPSDKMSKSDEDKNASIGILDKPELIIKKAKRAVTDSEANFAYRDEQGGLKNLINIYSSFSGLEIEAIVEKYKGPGYGQFKTDLGELIVSELKPIQDEYNRLLSEKSYLKEVMKDGAMRASEIASKKLAEVQNKIGFVSRT